MSSFSTRQTIRFVIAQKDNEHVIPDGISFNRRLKTIHPEAESHGAFVARVGDDWLTDGVGQ
ncbi:MAG: hypothetical protein JO334_08405 [Verrucomicrobia bacterium]|nr:hypothetical protein [Verrucomicrobiota bacterium]